MSAKRPTSSYETPPLHDTYSFEDFLTPSSNAFSCQNISLGSIPTVPNSPNSVYFSPPKVKASLTDVPPKSPLVVPPSSSNRLLRRISSKIFRRSPNLNNSGLSNDEACNQDLAKVEPPSSSLKATSVQPAKPNTSAMLAGSNHSSPSGSKIRDESTSTPLQRKQSYKRLSKHEEGIETSPDTHSLLRRFSFRRSKLKITEPASTVNDEALEKSTITRKSSIQSTLSKLEDLSSLSSEGSPSKTEISSPLSQGKHSKDKSPSKLNEGFKYNDRHSVYANNTYANVLSPSTKSDPYLLKGYLLPTLQDVPESTLPSTKNPFKIESPSLKDRSMRTIGDRLSSYISPGGNSSTISYRNFSTPTLHYEKPSAESSNKLQISDDVLKLKIYVELLAKPPFCTAEQEVIALIVRKDKLKNLNVLVNLIVFKLLTKKQDLNLNGVKLLIFFKNATLNPIVLKQSVSQTSKYKSVFLNNEDLLLDFVLTKRKLFIKAECQEF